MTNYCPAAHSIQSHNLQQQQNGLPPTQSIVNTNPERTFLVPASSFQLMRCAFVLGLRHVRGRMIVIERRLKVSRYRHSCATQY